MIDNADTRGELINRSSSEQFVASGKDSNVYLVHTPEGPIARKKYYKIKYAEQDSRIKDYAAVMNRAASLFEEDKSAFQLFGNNCVIKVNPVNRVYWENTEKLWVKESPSIKGTNLQKAFSVDEDGGSIGWRRVVDDNKLPSFVPLDEYFDFLDKLRILQEETGRKLGVNLHLSVENIMFTPEGEMVITDLGHEIESLGLPLPPHKK